MRKFESGAFRDDASHKVDFEACLSPSVLARYAQYMRDVNGENQRFQDNWQKGIPRAEYLKSALRHMMEVWAIHRRERDGNIEDALCALMFNVQGYLYEVLLREEHPVFGEIEVEDVDCPAQAGTASQGESLGTMRKR